jgi:hypothetical protein
MTFPLIFNVIARLCLACLLTQRRGLSGLMNRRQKFPVLIPGFLERTMIHLSRMVSPASPIRFRLVISLIVLRVSVLKKKTEVVSPGQAAQPQIHLSLVYGLLASDFF